MCRNAKFIQAMQEQKIVYKTQFTYSSKMEAIFLNVYEIKTYNFFHHNICIY